MFKQERLLLHRPNGGKMEHLWLCFGGKERKLKRNEFKLQRSNLWAGLLIRRENRDYLE